MIKHDVRTMEEAKKNPLSLAERIRKETQRFLSRLRSHKNRFYNLDGSLPETNLPFPRPTKLETMFASTTVNSEGDKTNSEDNGDNSHDEMTTLICGAPFVNKARTISVKSGSSGDSIKAKVSSWLARHEMKWARYGQRKRPADKKFLLCSRVGSNHNARLENKLSKNSSSWDSSLSIGHCALSNDHSSIITVARTAKKKCNRFRSAKTRDWMVSSEAVSELKTRDVDSKSNGMIVGKYRNKVSNDNTLSNVGPRRKWRHPKKHRAPVREANLDEKSTDSPDIISDILTIRRVDLAVSTGPRLLNSACSFHRPLPVRSSISSARIAAVSPQGQTLLTPIPPNTRTCCSELSVLKISQGFPESHATLIGGSQPPNEPLICSRSGTEAVLDTLKISSTHGNTSSTLASPLGCKPGKSVNLCLKKSEEVVSATMPSNEPSLHGIWRNESYVNQATAPEGSTCLPKCTTEESKAIKIHVHVPGVCRNDTAEEVSPQPSERFSVSTCATEVQNGWLSAEIEPKLYEISSGKLDEPITIVSLQKFEEHEGLEKSHEGDGRISADSVSKLDIEETFENESVSDQCSWVTIAIEESSEVTMVSDFNTNYSGVPGENWGDSSQDNDCSNEAIIAEQNSEHSIVAFDPMMFRFGNEIGVESNAARPVFTPCSLGALPGMVSYENEEHLPYFVKGDQREWANINGSWKSSETLHENDAKMSNCEELTEINCMTNAENGTMAKDHTEISIFTIDDSKVDENCDGILEGDEIVDIVLKYENWANSVVAPNVRKIIAKYENINTNGLKDDSLETTGTEYTDPASRESIDKREGRVCGEYSAARKTAIGTTNEMADKSQKYITGSRRTRNVAAVRPKPWTGQTSKPNSCSKDYHYQGNDHQKCDLLSGDEVQKGASINRKQENFGPCYRDPRMRTYDSENVEVGDMDNVSDQLKINNDKCPHSNDDKDSLVIYRTGLDDSCGTGQTLPKAKGRSNIILKQDSVALSDTRSELGMESPTDTQVINACRNALNHVQMDTKADSEVTMTSSWASCEPQKKELDNDKLKAKCLPAYSNNLGKTNLTISDWADEEDEEISFNKMILTMTEANHASFRILSEADIARSVQQPHVIQPKFVNNTVNLRPVRAVKVHEINKSPRTLVGISSSPQAQSREKGIKINAMLQQQPASTAETGQPALHTIAAANQMQDKTALVTNGDYGAISFNEKQNGVELRKVLKPTLTRPFVYEIGTTADQRINSSVLPNPLTLNEMETPQSGFAITRETEYSMGRDASLDISATSSFPSSMVINEDNSLDNKLQRGLKLAKILRQRARFIVYRNNNASRSNSAKKKGKKGKGKGKKKEKEEPPRPSCPQADMEAGDLCWPMADAYANYLRPVEEPLKVKKEKASKAKSAKPDVKVDEKNKKNRGKGPQLTVKLPKDEGSNLGEIIWDVWFSDWPTNKGPTSEGAAQDTDLTVADQTKAKKKKKGDKKGKKGRKPKEPKKDFMVFSDTRLACKKKKAKGNRKKKGSSGKKDLGLNLAPISEESSGKPLLSRKSSKPQERTNTLAESRRNKSPASGAARDAKRDLRDPGRVPVFSINRRGLTRPSSHGRTSRSSNRTSSLSTGRSSSLTETSSQSQERSTSQISEDDSTGMSKACNSRGKRRPSSLSLSKSNSKSKTISRPVKAKPRESQSRNKRTVPRKSRKASDVRSLYSVRDGRASPFASSWSVSTGQSPVKKRLPRSSRESAERAKSKGDKPANSRLSRSQKKASESATKDRSPVGKRSPCLSRGSTKSVTSQKTKPAIHRRRSSTETTAESTSTSRSPVGKKWRHRPSKVATSKRVNDAARRRTPSTAPSSPSTSRSPVRKESSRGSTKLAASKPGKSGISRRELSSTTTSRSSSPKLRSTNKNDINISAGKQNHSLQRMMPPAQPRSKKSPRTSSASGSERNGERSTSSKKTKKKGTGGKKAPEPTTSMYYINPDPACYDFRTAPKAKKKAKAKVIPRNFGDEEIKKLAKLMNGQPLDKPKAKKKSGKGGKKEPEKMDMEPIQAQERLVECIKWVISKQDQILGDLDRAIHLVELEIKQEPDLVWPLAKCVVEVECSLEEDPLEVPVKWPFPQKGFIFDTLKGEQLCDLEWPRAKPDPSLLPRKPPEKAKREKKKGQTGKRPATAPPQKIKEGTSKEVQSQKSMGEHSKEPLGQAKDNDSLASKLQNPSGSVKEKEGRDDKEEPPLRAVMSSSLKKKSNEDLAPAQISTKEPSDNRDNQAASVMSQATQVKKNMSLKNENTSSSKESQVSNSCKDQCNKKQGQALGDTYTTQHTSKSKSVESAYNKVPELAHAQKRVERVHNIDTTAKPKARTAFSLRRKSHSADSVSYALQKSSKTTNNVGDTSNTTPKQHGADVTLRLTKRSHSWSVNTQKSTSQRSLKERIRTPSTNTPSTATPSNLEETPKANLPSLPSKDPTGSTPSQMSFKEKIDRLTAHYASMHENLSHVLTDSKTKALSQSGASSSEENEATEIVISKISSITRSRKEILKKDKSASKLASFLVSQGYLGNTSSDQPVNQAIALPHPPPKSRLAAKGKPPLPSRPIRTRQTRKAPVTTTSASRQAKGNPLSRQSTTYRTNSEPLPSGATGQAMVNLLSQQSTSYRANLEPPHQGVASQASVNLLSQQSTAHRTNSEPLYEQEAVPDLRKTQSARDHVPDKEEDSDEVKMQDLYKKYHPRSKALSDSFNIHIVAPDSTDTVDGPQSNEDTFSRDVPQPGCPTHGWQGSSTRYAASWPTIVSKTNTHFEDENSSKNAKPRSSDNTEENTSDASAVVTPNINFKRVKHDQIHTTYLAAKYYPWYGRALSQEIVSSKSQEDSAVNSSSLSEDMLSDANSGKSVQHSKQASATPHQGSNQTAEVHTEPSTQDRNMSCKGESPTGSGAFISFFHDQPLTDFGGPRATSPEFDLRLGQQTLPHQTKLRQSDSAKDNIFSKIRSSMHGALGTSHNIQYGTPTTIHLPSRCRMNCHESTSGGGADIRHVSGQQHKSDVSTPTVCFGGQRIQDSSEARGKNVPINSNTESHRLCYAPEKQARSRLISGEKALHLGTSLQKGVANSSKTPQSHVGCKLICEAVAPCSGVKSDHILTDKQESTPVATTNWPLPGICSIRDLSFLRELLTYDTYFKNDMDSSGEV